jgi:CRISPR/Cas system Type II protein with McrA/HNH and RuvC-like nuclease domain
MTMLLGENEPVYCVEYYNKSIRDTVGRQYKLPSVLVLKNYVYVDVNKAIFSKINVYYRDKFTCAYCFKQLKRDELTIDHIIPRSRWKDLGNKGSVNTFENVVTCCQKCNIRKGSRTLKEAGMVLQHQPKKVSRRQAFINRIMMHEIPESWTKYLESANILNAQPQTT